MSDFKVGDVRSHHVGNSDYSNHKIQPYDIFCDYQLDPFRAELIKRLLRTKEEEGMTLRDAKLLDLKKIQHTVTFMIELYESNNFPWDKNDTEKKQNKEEPGMTADESRRLDYEKIIHIYQERMRQIDESS